MYRMALALSFLLVAGASILADEGDYGIYEDLGQYSGEDALAAFTGLRDAVEADPRFQLLSAREVAAPDRVRERDQDRDGRRGWLLSFVDPAYMEELAALHPKYAVAGLSRIGIHEDPTGVRITCLQMETLARIVANDLEDDATYESLARKAATLTAEIRRLARESLDLSGEVTPMPPLRDRDRLRKGKKDMFMMVGPMTYFRDDGQFPLIHSEALGPDPSAQITALADGMTGAMEAFRPIHKDLEYCWSPDPGADLQWKPELRYEIPGKALLLGISRPRTEALAMHIAGMKRSKDDWRSPGLDHLCAFPVEVLIYVDGQEIQVRTAREMFRMDQFFWDAGKGAFMKYATLPGLLDRSIKRALLGE